MTLIEAESPIALSVQLSRLDISVPRRSDGRTTEQAERYCIAHLLSSLPSDRMRFPLSVIHRDKPDFLLESGDWRVGIEHTEAVPPNIAHASFLREKGEGPEVYFTPRAVPGEAVRSAAQLREEIRADEPGEPWCGDTPEREWATAMLFSAEAKVSKARHPEFEAFGENWLLIYDAWPLPPIKPDRAGPLLWEALSTSSVPLTFDKIFVLDSTCLFEFDTTWRTHAVRRPRRPLIPCA
ncbi:hypothetical protein [Variovorax sp. DAIF25]|uniref:hypothetical protein n=1 Tax=Variovorax sp. DAIF25 TaxID=3080983 RepID=UPI003D6C67D2